MGGGEFFIYKYLHNEPFNFSIKSVCFDFCSTNVCSSVISIGRIEGSLLPYFYRFRCHYLWFDSFLAINYFNLIQQSRQQEIKAYCPNIFTLMTDKTNSYLAAGKCAITALQPQICAFSSAQVPLPHLGNSNFFNNGCGVSNWGIQT